MPQSHTIRLRAPWIRETTPGGLRLRRSFNCPTGLDGNEQVWIVVAGLAAAGGARFNGQELGPLSADTANEFDVTSRLTPWNEICLDLNGNPQQFSSIDDPNGVSIEIRSA